MSKKTKEKEDLESTSEKARYSSNNSDAEEIVDIEWSELILGRFEEKNGEFVQVEVDEVTRLVCNVRPKRLSHDAMPARSK